MDREAHWAKISMDSVLTAANLVAVTSKARQERF